MKKTCCLILPVLCILSLLLQACSGPSNTPLPTSPIPNTSVVNTPIPNTAVVNTPIPNTLVPNTPIPNTPIPNTPAPTKIASPIPPAQASVLWYVAFPDLKSPPVLQAVPLDGQARRTGAELWVVDLGLEPTWPGHSLWSLDAAPDGKSLLASVSYGDGLRPNLLDLRSGKVQNLLPEEPMPVFLAWGLGGKSAIFQPEPGPNAPLVLDFASGASRPFVLPDGGGYPPQVNGLAWSPDGRLLADAFSYPPIYQQREQGFLEIGLRTGLDGPRSVLCTILDSVGAIHGSLAWSPDGRLLAWTDSINLPGGRADRLWLADIPTGGCRILATLAEKINYSLPPAWSPDGRWIAAVTGRRSADGQDEYYDGLLLVDPVTGKTENLALGEPIPPATSTLPPEPPPAPGPSGMAYRSWGLSHLNWSPDGRYLAFTLSLGRTAEIRAVELATRKVITLAGPTPPLAPFAWVTE